MRQQINKGNVSYHPNTLGGGCPFQAMKSEGGFSSFEERIDSKKIRARSQSFFDHFSQAILFYNSQSETEKNHITHALRFELSKVQVPEIRERMVGLLTQVDRGLAEKVGDALGIKAPNAPQMPMNHSVPADGNSKKFQPVKVEQTLQSSAALSMANTKKDSIKTRQVAILAANGVDDAALNKMKDMLVSMGAQCKVIAPKLGEISGTSGNTVKADQSFLIAASVLFDAVYVPGGAESVNALIGEAEALHFIEEAYKHCKPIAAENEARELLEFTYLGNKMSEEGYVASADGLILSEGKSNFGKSFVEAIKQHRFYERENESKIPA